VQPNDYIMLEYTSVEFVANIFLQAFRINALLGGGNFGR
jgi:hypothetical protein